MELLAPSTVLFKSYDGTKIKTISALTNSAISWPEIMHIEDISSANISIFFEDDWICCCPRPSIVVPDIVNDFKG